MAGAPASAIPWAELAARPPTTRRAPEGFEGGLDAENDFETPDATYPFGTHLAVVEVDTETGLAQLVRHITVDDAGRITNPLLVEGQVHGGIAQGVAQALFEEIAFDEDGNNVTGSLASYAIPSAGDLPSFETERTQTPTPRNPLGAKGIGEAGAIGSTPAVWNAVVDALSHLGVRNIDMPATPQRVWQAISAAADLAERADQRVDVLGRRAEPDARPDRSGQLGLAAGAQLARAAARASASGHAQQPGDQRVRAEAAVADADRVLGAEASRPARRSR